ncbi:MAG TPA: zinc-binding dehydrogenase [Vicinamibacteria bacterium]|nr:zinc-binding dehydrogenase [Vicinamibacteria bacterium]
MDIDPAKLTLARSYGADLVFDSRADVAETIQQQTGGLIGVVDFVGAQQTSGLAGVGAAHRLHIC